MEKHFSKHNAVTECNVIIEEKGQAKVMGINLCPDKIMLRIHWCPSKGLRQFSQVKQKAQRISSPFTVHSSMYYKSEAEIINSLQTTCSIAVLSVEQSSSSLHESLLQNFKKFFYNRIFPAYIWKSIWFLMRGSEEAGTDL